MSIDEHDHSIIASAAAASDECEESRLLLSRRAMLGATAGLFSWAMVPKAAEAASPNADPRLLVVVLRGGMDGLSLVVPHGDPNYVSTRGALAMPVQSTLKLDSFFALHPQMAAFARLYRAGDAAIVQATCPPVRTRSHFDCQDNLENGMPGLAYGATGWLNRLLAVLPADSPVRLKGAVQVADSPLLLRGSAPVLAWSVSSLNRAPDATLDLIGKLYRDVDPAYAAVLQSGRASRRLAEGVDAGNRKIDGLQRSFEGAGRLLGSASGPRIAVLSVHSWDTHATQGSIKGKVADRLGELDRGIAGFQAAVGRAWSNTVVLIVTEFGRTVRNNGINGTDHGTATVALLAGGAVQGGRILGDWPGLAPRDLLEGRDLKPSSDLRSVFKGVLREHLDVPDTILDRDIFPDSRTVRPMRGLIRGA